MFCIFSGIPRECIKHIPAPCFATTSNSFLSNDPAEISLTIVAPACNAFSATIDFLVSTEIIAEGTEVFIFSITPIILSISIVDETSLAPGLVDSPPISKTVHPIFSRSSPFSTNCFSVKNFSPS